MTPTPARASPPARYLYVFLDEAGNFDFSPNGTKVFVLGAVTRERPFHAYKDLTELKYDLAERGLNLEYFHATEDAQTTRNEVFEIVRHHLDGARFDSLIVEKCKTGPALRPPDKFYPRMLGYLLRHVLTHMPLADYAEVLVFTDRIPVNSQRSAVEKAIKVTLAAMLPAGSRYRLFHHESKSNFDLQIADYFTWAIYRKWNTEDLRSYQIIQPAVASEFDIFATGLRHYY